MNTKIQSHDFELIYIQNIHNIGSSEIVLFIIKKNNKYGEKEGLVFY